MASISRVSGGQCFAAVVSEQPFLTALTQECFVEWLQNQGVPVDAVHREYHALLAQRGFDGPIPCGEDRYILIARPDLYLQAYRKVCVQYSLPLQVHSFPYRISSGTCFWLLDDLNRRYSANVRGEIHQEYNQLLQLLAQQDHLPIPGNDLETLGLSSWNADYPSVEVNPALYFQAMGTILRGYDSVQPAAVVCGGSNLEQSASPLLELPNEILTAITQYVMTENHMLLSRMTLRNAFLFANTSFRIHGIVMCCIKESCDARVNTVSDLDLDRCALRFIPRVIRGLPNLSRLQCRNNFVLEIPLRVLSQFRQLKCVDLAGNRLTHLDPRTFEGCDRLESLDLSDNQLTQFDRHTLDSCPNLEFLDLSNNQLTAIDSQMFVRLYALKYFAIPGNRQIIELDVGIFTPLVRRNLRAVYPVFDLEMLFISWRARPPYVAAYALPKFLAFAQYRCRSQLATFYRAVSNTSLATPALQEALGRLEERHLLFKGVYCAQKEFAESIGGIFLTEDEQWGEHHVFDHMLRFTSLLKQVILEEYERFSDAQKCAVHGKIYELAREDADLDALEWNKDGPEWGQRHIPDNILRFIDAIVLVRDSS